jgi:hypothetical protein
VSLVGLGPVVGQRRVVDGRRRTGPDLMPQAQQVLATDPTSRASLAVGTPWAMPLRITRIRAGSRWVPCQFGPMNMLNTRWRALQRQATAGESG